MLYLVRKKGESVIINGNIEVQVIEIKGKSVKIGFNFPSTSTVLRKEIHDRIVEENIAAAASAKDGVDLSDLNVQMNLKGSGTEKEADGNRVSDERKPSDAE